MVKWGGLVLGRQAGTYWVSCNNFRMETTRTNGLENRRAEREETGKKKKNRLPILCTYCGERGNASGQNLCGYLNEKCLRDDVT